QPRNNQPRSPSVTWCPSWLSLLRPRPPGHNGRRNPAAWTKLAPHLRPCRLRPLHYVLEDLVDHVFLENPEVAVALQIFLQRLQFKTELVWHVLNLEHAEIRQPGLGAN